MIAKGLHTALKQDGYAVDGVSDGAARPRRCALRDSIWCCSISVCRSAMVSTVLRELRGAAMRRR